MVTLKNNYIYHFSGRTPKVAGSTLVHAVNNYWFDYADTGHAFEILKGAMVLAEGNVFQNIATELESATFTGQMYTPDGGSACKAVLGRTCPMNIFGASGALSKLDTSFLPNFADKNIAAAVNPTGTMETTIPANAGNVL